MRVLPGLRNARGGTGLIAAILLLKLCFASSLGAQPPASTPANGTQPANPIEDVAVEEIDSILAAVEQDQTLDEAIRTQIQELARQAKQDLADTAAYVEATATFTNQLNEVETTAESLRQSLEAMRSAETLEPARTTIAILKAELADFERQLEQARLELQTANSNNNARLGRRRQMRDLLQSQPQNLARVQRDLQAEPPAEQVPALTQMRRLSLLAELKELQAMPAAISAEFSAYDAEDAAQIPRLRTDFLQAQIDNLTRTVRIWQEEISKQERIDVQSRISEIEIALRGSIPDVVRFEIEENLRIVQEEAEQREARDEVQQDLGEYLQLRTALEERFQNLQERSTAASQSTALGIRLREQRASLPEARVLEREIADALRDLEEVELARIDADDRLQQLGDGKQYVALLVENIRREMAMTPNEREELRQTLQSVIERRLEYLPRMIDAYGEYSRELSEYIEELQSYWNVVREVTQFCDERILWIRSHRPIWTINLMSDTESLTWIISSATWRELWSAMQVDVWSEPWLYVAAIVVFLVLITTSAWHRHRLRSLSKTASSRILGDIRPTLQACVHTVMLAIAWPSLGLLLGYRMSTSLEGSAVVRRVGQNLIAVNLAVLGLEFLRHLVRPNGLAESHFRWAQGPLNVIRHQISRWILLGVPLLLLIAVLNARVTDSTNDLLERVAFSVLMVLFSAGLHVMLRPKTGALTEWVKTSSSVWFAKMQGLWSVVVSLLPLFFVGLTLSGYYYTAVQLLQKLSLTCALAMAVILVRAIIFRWLMLRRRRLAVEQARERRSQAMAAATSESISKPLSTETLDIPSIDLASISDQSQRLIATTLAVLTLMGAWLIWVDVLPALNYFERWGFEVYEQRVEEMTTEDGGIEYDTKLVPRMISVVSMMQALLIVILMATAARNLPGMLEIVLLERLPVEHSSRYAVTTVVRYVIILTGVIFASQAVGLSWSSVQWLAAALTFGLGFGLQEIFANFVSGLIILFEQPVRVGDVVTIDGVTGKVSRVRIRSTTVTDWDRKDYIVPNREFITGKLLNWTRSDTVTRLAIPVGISYKADAEKAREIILKIAENHPAVMKEPPPVVFMEGFGESALNMKLFVYLPNLESRLEALHQINVAIHRTFAEHGVEIPFPQTDLHIRSWPDELTHALLDNHGTSVANSSPH